MLLTQQRLGLIGSTVSIVNQACAEDNVLQVVAEVKKSLAVGCFKELSKMATPEQCAEAVDGEPACAVKNAFSYGFGSRARRCICDIRENCELKDHEEFRRYEKKTKVEVDEKLDHKES